MLGQTSRSFFSNKLFFVRNSRLFKEQRLLVEHEARQKKVKFVNCFRYQLTIYFTRIRTFIVTNFWEATDFWRTAETVLNSFLSSVARWYIFKTKNPNLGKFLGALQRKMLVYFISILSIPRPIIILNGNLVHFVVLFPVLVCCTPKIWQPWSLAQLMKLEPKGNSRHQTRFVINFI
jgi:hypothetical protein